MRCGVDFTRSQEHHDAFRRSKLTYGTDKTKEAAGASGQTKSSDAVASEAYWVACNHRATLFVDRHYRWPGVYALHRTAFGFDLLKAPVNVLLALPAVVVQIIGLALRRLGAYGVASACPGSAVFTESSNGLPACASVGV